MNRLRELRLKNHINIGKICEIMDLSISHMYSLEKEQKRLSSDYAAMAADFYNVSTDYILGLTDIPARPLEKEPETNRENNILNMTREEQLKAADAVLEWVKDQREKLNEMEGLMKKIKETNTNKK